MSTIRAPHPSLLSTTPSLQRACHAAALRCTSTAQVSRRQHTGGLRSISSRQSLIYFFSQGGSFPPCFSVGRISSFQSEVLRRAFPTFHTTCAARVAAPRLEHLWRYCTATVRRLCSVQHCSAGGGRQGRCVLRTRALCSNHELPSSSSRWRPATARALPTANGNAWAVVAWVYPPRCTRVHTSISVRVVLSPSLLSGGRGASGSHPEF